MEQVAFTPVERGVLMILMSKAEPVRQTDFDKLHGLAVKKQHRQKLAHQGLIEVSTKPKITYALTKKGWTWLSQEVTASKPKGSMGLGPLYAVLGAVDRLAKKLGKPLDKALSPDPISHPEPNQDIRPPEWIEVDELVARAMQDMTAFGAAISRLKDIAKDVTESDVKRAEIAANLVFQSVKLAGKKRALDLDGAVGTEASFDPVFFHSDENIEFGAPVRIRKSPVTRGHGAQKIIIRPGLVEPIRS
jgi:hypothetical protein